MKKIIMMMAVCAAMIGVMANAATDEKQSKQQRGERPDATTMMTKFLNLTTEQQAQVKEINEKYADVIAPQGGPGGRHGGPGRPGEGGPDSTQVKNKKAPKKDFKKQEAKQQCDSCKFDESKRPSKEEMEAAMKERQEKLEAYKAELKGVLTDEQYAKLEKMSQRGPRGQRGGGPQGGERPDGPAPEGAPED